MKKTIEGYIMLDELEKAHSVSKKLHFSKAMCAPSDIKVIITYELPAKKYSVTAEEIANAYSGYLSNQNDILSFEKYLESRFNQEGK